MSMALLILLVVYQIKHFVADYPLQNKYMLGKFQKFPKYIMPLLAHVGVHAGMTFVIALFFKPVLTALALAMFDMTVHFIVDRIKASPDIGGRFSAVTKTEYHDHIHDLEDYDKLIAELPTWEASRCTGTDECQECINSSLRRNLTVERVEMVEEWTIKMKSNTYFWWALGADQFMHHITHYAIIYVLVS